MLHLNDSVYKNGKRIREATGEADYAAARQRLNQRLGAIAKVSLSNAIANQCLCRNSMKRWSDTTASTLGSQLTRSRGDGNI